MVKYGTHCSSTLQWDLLDTEEWTPDHSSLVTEPMRLTKDDAGGSEARYSFTLEDIFPERKGWDVSSDFHASSQYSDLVRMRMLQLRVAFSVCNDKDQCSLWDEPKSVRLGVQEGEMFPTAYVVEGSKHHTVILHTDFCRHATLKTTW